MIEIRLAKLDQILDLRWRVLRTGLPRQTAIFEGDEEPTTRHLAAVLDGRVVGCATLLRRPWMNQPAWQLRGMAVEPQYQRRGIGTLLLQAIERIVRAEPHSLQLWCNARTPAIEFYRRHGWQCVGDEFVIPTAGPHYRMCKRLDAAEPLMHTQPSAR
ncbi:MAG TPA: GNAT family N-acetyltransferase [Tepidisphaeraceae bacterium]|nr:GNAT family N-acetyltransferase [Tepidisphaeraceae bacterium]